MNTTLDEYTEKAREAIRAHAIKAIQVLEHQLTTAKSSIRIAKITSRIADWKKSLDMLGAQNAKKEDNHT